MSTTNTHIAIHLALASGGTSKRDGEPCIENPFTIALIAGHITRLARKHTKLWADFSSALLTIGQAEAEAKSNALIEEITELAKPFNVEVKASRDPRGPTITLITTRRIRLRGKPEVHSDLVTCA